MSRILRLSLALDSGTELFFDIFAWCALVVRIVRGMGRPFLPGWGLRLGLGLGLG